MPNVFIVGVDYPIEEMFKTRGWDVTSELSEANLVQFTGGADVTPRLYGQDRGGYTRSDAHRDIVELSYFFKALNKFIPMAGICRGGQFLHVCGGGSLRQHVEGHLGHHYMKSCYSQYTIQVTSTHHQVMKQDAGEVLYKAGEDAEVVYHGHINALCFQPHPEYDGVPDCTDLYFTLINQILGVK